MRMLFLFIACLPVFADVFTSTGGRVVSGSKVRYVGAAVAPSKASGFSPADSATHQVLQPTLSWSAASGASSYDVWVGYSLGSIAKVSAAQSGLSYLVTNTAYAQAVYWRIDPKNSIGTTTGDVLSFQIVTPVLGDLLVNFEDGSNGDVLTTNVLNSMTVGNAGFTKGTWHIKQGQAGTNVSATTLITVTNDNHTLRSPVTVDGSTDTGAGTRTIEYDQTTAAQFQYLAFTLTNAPVTVVSGGFYWRSGVNSGSGNQWDLFRIIMRDVVAGQAAINFKEISGSSLVVRTETAPPPDEISVFATNIAIQPSTLYWMTWKWEASVAFTLRVYETSTWTQVGADSSAAVGGGENAEFQYGIVSNLSASGAHYRFENLIMNWTTAPFPLGP